MKFSDMRKSALSMGATWATVLVVYLLLVGSTSPSEVVVGAALAAAAALLLTKSKSVGVLPLRLRWRFVVPSRYLPWAVLLETGQILYALALRLAGRDVQGVTLRLGFTHTGRDLESAMRRSIAIFGVTISPNSYVVRVDVDRREILIRQLVGRELSKCDSEFLRVG